MLLGCRGDWGPMGQFLHLGKYCLYCNQHISEKVMVAQLHYWSICTKRLADISYDLYPAEEHLQIVIKVAHGTPCRGPMSHPLGSNESLRYKIKNSTNSDEHGRHGQVCEL